jgi:hypothetical protein
VLALPLHLPLRPLRRQQHLTQTGGDTAGQVEKRSRSGANASIIH